MLKRAVLAFLSCVLLLPGVCRAEDAPAARPTYQVKPVAQDIHVDGVLDEAVWKLPPTFTLDYETSPGDNIPARVHTDMWVTYDRSRLYIAARAQDPHPEQIRARLTDRDKNFDDDFVGVVLDTFNDERRAFEFVVNPLGVQGDLQNSDVTGNEDASWDAIWSSAGRITSTGYEVEIAIPFSSLRFPAASEPATWGIDAVRYYPRDQNYKLGLSRLPRGRNCYLCNESKLHGFQGIHPGRNLEFDPTATAHREDQRDSPDADFRPHSNAEGGLTARWGLSPGITANGAINPDFSQVEADAAQLTVNTQFAIFYPEKRPFFLEGADIFDTKIQAIYTRDIADPSWGLKLSGKEGASAFGGIVSRDDFTNFIFPGSQSTQLGSLDQPNTSTILRYRHDAGSESTIGSLFTDREAAGYFNRVLGGDTLIRHGDEAFRLEVLGSMTEYPESIQADFAQPDGTLYGTALRTAYQHSTSRWTGYGQYYGASDDFRADLGFIPQVGFHKGYGFLEGYWYSDNNEHWWRKLTLGSETTWVYDRSGSPLQQAGAAYFLVNGPYEFFSNLYVSVGPLYYNGQRFNRNFVDETLDVRPTSWLYFEVNARVGDEIDYDNTRQGSILRLAPLAEFQLGRHLRLAANHRYETLDVDGERLYRANVTDARITYQINARTFVRLVTQVFDVRRDPSLYTFPVSDKDTSVFNQFLFSYKVNPQVVLFLGYSDAYQNGPNYNLSQANRTVFFKVGYAFVL